MGRIIAFAFCVLAATACSEATNKPPQDPSTTSVTSAPATSGNAARPDPSEEREDHGDSLRN